MFYPADFTFVCATEFSALAEQHAALKAIGVELLTVSTDTKFTHMAWQRDEGELKGVQYAMASDTTGKVSKMFGVYMAEAGLALRGSFIIGPDGKLHGSEINFEMLRREMKHIQNRSIKDIFGIEDGIEFR